MGVLDICRMDSPPPAFRGSHFKAFFWRLFFETKAEIQVISVETVTLIKLMITIGVGNAEHWDLSCYSNATPQRALAPKIWLLVLFAAPTEPLCWVWASGAKSSLHCFFFLTPWNFPCSFHWLKCSFPLPGLDCSVVLVWRVLLNYCQASPPKWLQLSGESSVSCVSGVRSEWCSAGVCASLGGELKILTISILQTAVGKKKELVS